MKKYILELLSKGHSDKEIAVKCLEHVEAKELDSKAILAILDEAKKEAQLTAELSEREAKELKEKTKEEAKKEAKELVAEELKKIGVDKFSRSSEKVKTYNYASGEYEELNDRDTDSVIHTGKMLKALLAGRTADAEAISRDIDSENRKAANVAGTDNVGGYAVATPVDNQIHELIYKQSVAMNNFNTDVIMQNDKIYPVMANASIGWIANEDTAATQTTPAFSNPTTEMFRAGAFSALSNKLIGATEADIVNAFVRSYSSAFARFVDAQIFIGNITGNGDKIDGLVWNANTVQQTAIALSALGVDDVKGLLKAISDEATNVKLFGNKSVLMQLGLDESTGGTPFFPNFVNGGSIAPFGVPFVENTKITNVLDVGGDNSTGGTDTVIMAVDCDAVMLGVGKTTRIEMSKDFLFTKDQVVIRGIKDFGYCTLFGSGQTVQNLELTGA